MIPVVGSLKCIVCVYARLNRLLVSETRGRNMFSVLCLLISFFLLLLCSSLQLLIRNRFLVVDSLLVVTESAVDFFVAGYLVSVAAGIIGVVDPCKLDDFFPRAFQLFGETRGAARYVVGLRAQAR
jgi:hypothetical protein